jgi:hypothetical protein
MNNLEVKEKTRLELLNDSYDLFAAQFGHYNNDIKDKYNLTILLRNLQNCYHFQTKEKLFEFIQKLTLETWKKLKFRKYIDVVAIPSNYYEPLYYQSSLGIICVSQKFQIKKYHSLLTNSILNNLSQDKIIECYSDSLAQEIDCQILNHLNQIDCESMMYFLANNNYNFKIDYDYIIGPKLVTDAAKLLCEVLNLNIEITEINEYKVFAGKLDNKPIFYPRFLIQTEKNEITTFTNFSQDALWIKK